MWWSVVVCGGLRWSAVVCGGLRWSAVFRQTPLGSLQHSLRPLSSIKGPTSKAEGREGGESGTGSFVEKVTPLLLVESV